MESISHIFNIDTDFNPNQDEVMNLINGIDKKDFDFSSGYVFMQLEEIENLDIDSACKLLKDKNNQSWGFLEDERKKQFFELERLLEEFKSFYTTRWEYNKISANGFTPQEITYFVNKYLIRLQRLILVLNPQLSFTSSEKKGTGRSYDMVKAYWINDDGQKVRNFTKNIGNSETAVIELLDKLTSIIKGQHESYQPKLKNGLTPDVVVAVGNKKWVVETNILEKEDYGRTFVIFELWKKYKETYTLYS